jgi:thiol-disulfide isomerase/thioredoxin
MRWVVCGLLVGCVPVLESPEGEAESDVWVAPENGWPIAEPPSGLEAEGYELGQIVPDVRGLDVDGDEVSLWQFYGSVIVLDISTMWCSPCRDLAEKVQETADHYGDALVYLTIMPEDLEYETPSEDELAEWMDYYGILTEPVLSDPDQYSYDVVPPGSATGFPAVFVIGRDLRIGTRVNPPTDDNVRAALDEIL